MVGFPGVCQVVVTISVNHKITIAVDGFSSCGKSTLAKDLAQKLGYHYLDSGAMYRAVTWYFLHHNFSWAHQEEVAKILPHLHIHFEVVQGNQHTFLNGQDVEQPIRGVEVSAAVSHIAAISAVRRFLVGQQQSIGKHKGIVMDGRDIGTVVFPDAELKIFLTAALPVRVKRRYDELRAKGLNVSMEEVQKNLQERDFIDSNREDSPLRKADDAVVLDNSNLDKQQQIDIAYKWALQRLQQ